MAVLLDGLAKLGISQGLGTDILVSRFKDTNAPQTLTAGD
jgi:hypothetical protein